MSNYYGYGIAVSKKMNPETTSQLIDLLQKAPQFRDFCIEELEEYLENHPEKDYEAVENIPVEECLEVINDASDRSDFETIAPILEAVVFETEGIHLCAAQDIWTRTEFLVLMPSFPWTFNKNERDMIPITMEDIVMKYLSTITSESPVFECCEWTE